MIGRDYRYFIEIAQQQSIQAAADILFVTPSALSKYVQRLESQMGVQLFDRAGKKFVPTYAGMRYLSWCLRMEGMERDCAEEMQRIVQNGKKLIRIGFPFMRVKGFFNCVMPEFARRYPQVDFSVCERNSSLIWPMFFQNKLDVIFMYKDPSFVSSNIHNEIISEERMVLCVPKGSPIGQLSVTREGFDYPWVDLTALKDEKLIVMTEAVSDVLGSIETIFSQYIDTPRVVLRTMGFESIAIAISQGMGISIMSDHVVDLLGYRDKMDMYAFGEKQIACHYRAFHHNNPFLDEEIRSLIDIAKANL